MPERRCHRRSSTLHQCALIVIWYSANAFRKRSIDFIEPSLRPLNHVRCVCAIQFENEASNGFSLSVCGCHALPDAAANNDRSKIADTDSPAIDRSHRRLFKVRYRARKANTAYGVLLSANFYELGSGRTISAFECADHV